MYIGQQPSTTFDSGIQDRFTGLTTNTVTLTHDISSEVDILVVWNNIVQDSSTYSVGGAGNKTLTLGGTLSSGDVVTVYYTNKVMQSVNPTAGSVTTTTINDGAVTNDKLSGSIANSKLANSSITLNGSAVSLGGSATVGGTNTPLFMASMGGNQTISANTATKINFNREVLDSDNKYSTTDMRFSPGETGYYTFQICTTVEGTVGNSEHSYWYVYKNGSSIAINPIHRGHVAGDTMVTLFIDQATSSSDYYEAYFQQDVGNNFDVGYESGSSALSYWLGYKLIS